tara:strand:+ start:95 stop:268 length:174 start_codon:yes stop_codon:yes gene_type:complete
MTQDSFIIIKHQLADENPQDSFDAITSMTLEDTLAYVEAEGTNTSENILRLATELST